MKPWSVFLATVFLLAIGSLIFAWSGIYNIAANEPHHKWTLWLLIQARDRSISFHTKDVRITLPVEPRQLSMGIAHYHGMCRLCHGAPGFPRLEFARGLYPAPPALTSQEVQKRPDVELFWIIQNGIKMTGMPSFGETHGEVELLGLLAVLKSLPSLSAEDYKGLVGTVSENQDDHHGAPEGMEQHEKMHEHGEQPQHMHPEGK